jgi:hypothetical protein
MMSKCLLGLSIGKTVTIHPLDAMLQIRPNTDGLLSDQLLSLDAYLG